MFPHYGQKRSVTAQLPLIISAGRIHGSDPFPRGCAGPSLAGEPFTSEAVVVQHIRLQPAVCAKANTVVWLDACLSQSTNGRVVDY
jgi:hypothetical protein